jgi:UDP-N-acetylglucosamine diphosphorylase/glucosamine-1-phosphate N-acetyltransferase
LQNITKKTFKIMKIIIFDPAKTRENLLPLTYTRPVGALRVGITTLAEKWQALLPGEYSWLTENYLAEKFPNNGDTSTDLMISGDIIADTDLALSVSKLTPGEALYDTNNQLIANYGTEQTRSTYSGEVKRISMAYDIFMLNGDVLKTDFERLTAGRKSQVLSDTNTVIGDRSLIFLEEGATVEGAFLNTKNGPIYVGSNAEIMEGSTLRGPIAIGEHSCVNMGTKVYGATTLGPWCKVGGELNNVVIQGYSNKAHDGFLGNAVIGEWCNLGAGCVASNLKNDYTEIKLWNYPAHRFLRTGLQFCGLIMGDHSKAGINTMFNTATVVGVGVNVHGAGFPRNFIASFSEGGTAGFSDVPMSKFFAIAERVMARRHVTLTDTDRNIYLAIRDYAENYK